MSDAAISDGSAPQRVIGRPFNKGVSGNPSGRPKGDVQALAREHTQAAIETLVSCLADPRLKVQAAIALLDRGWGKPAQTIQAADADGNHFTFQHLIAARAVLVEINAERSIEGRVVSPETNSGAFANPNASKQPPNLWEAAQE